MTILQHPPVAQMHMSHASNDGIKPLFESVCFRNNGIRKSVPVEPPKAVQEPFDSDRP